MGAAFLALIAMICRVYCYIGSKTAWVRDYQNTPGDIESPDGFVCNVI